MYPSSWRLLGRWCTAQTKKRLIWECKALEVGATLPSIDHLMKFAPTKEAAIIPDQDTGESTNTRFDPVWTIMSQPELRLDSSGGHVNLPALAAMYSG